jgi:hypothetical protein
VVSGRRPGVPRYPHKEKMKFPHLTSEKRREMTQVVRLPEIINMLSEWYVTPEY